MSMQVILGMSIIYINILLDIKTVMEDSW